MAWRRRSFPSGIELLPCWEPMRRMFMTFSMYVWNFASRTFGDSCHGFEVPDLSYVPKRLGASSSPTINHQPGGLNPLIHGQGPITGHIETLGHDNRHRELQLQLLSPGFPTTDLFMQSIDICSLVKVC